MSGGRAESSNKPVNFVGNVCVYFDIPCSSIFKHITLLKWALRCFDGGTIFYHFHERLTTALCSKENLSPSILNLFMVFRMTLAQKLSDIIGSTYLLISSIFRFE